MRKLQFFLLAALPLFFAQCKDDKLPSCPGCEFTCLEGNENGLFTNGCQSNWDCRYKIHENAQIQYEEGEHEDLVSIQEGSHLVFETILETEGAANVADDEFTNKLYFEIDPSQESFFAEGDQLDLLNLRFQQYCYCVDVHFNKPSSGCLQGQKIDENYWKIQANLIIDFSYGTEEVKVDAVYELE